MTDVSKEAIIQAISAVGKNSDVRYLEYWGDRVCLITVWNEDSEQPTREGGHARFFVSFGPNGENGISKGMLDAYVEYGTELLSLAEKGEYVMPPEPMNHGWYAGYQRLRSTRFDMNAGKAV